MTKNEGENSNEKRSVFLDSKFHRPKVLLFYPRSILILSSMSSKVPKTLVHSGKRRGRPTSGFPTRRWKKNPSFESTTNESSNAGAGSSNQLQQPTDFADLLDDVL